MGILKLKPIPKKTLDEICVLIVDDDELFREAMLFELEFHGIKAVGANNGNEAFEYIQNNHVDVVISDVKMPNGSGIELLDKVHNEAPYLPVVMLVTGFTDITSEQACSKGASAMFSKPFKPDELIDAIKKMVDFQDQEVKPQRAQVPVEIKFTMSENTSQGQVFTLGESGMFLSIAYPFPQIAEQVSIKISTAGENFIEAMGTVKWTHVKSTDYFPSGCAIEFNHLTDEASGQISKLIENEKN